MTKANNGDQAAVPAELVAAVSRISHSAEDTLSGSLHKVLGLTVEIFNRVDFAYVSLLSKYSGNARLVSALGIDRPAVRDLDISDGDVAQWVYETCKPSVLPGLNRRFSDPKNMSLSGEIISPLRYDTHVIGFLVIGSFENTFDSSLPEPLQIIADAIALEIQNKVFYEAALHLSEVTFESLEPSSISHDLARAANRIMDAPVACVWLIFGHGKEVTLSLTGWHGAEIVTPRIYDIPWGPRELSWEVIERTESEIGNAASTPCPFLVEYDLGLPESKYSHPSFVRANNLRSMISMPLVGHDKVMGVCNVYSKRTYRFFDREVVLLQNLSTQGGSALRNSVIMDHIDRVSRQEARLELARDVVHSLTASSSGLMTRLRTIQTTVEKIESSGPKVNLKKHARQLHMRLSEFADILRTQDNILSRYRQIPVAEHSGIKTVVDLAKTVKNVAAFVGHRARLKDVYIDLDVVPRRAEIEWYETDIYIIFLNLADNAVKFSRRGGKVYLRLHKKAGAYVFSVRDFGVGIHRNFKSRIWEVGFSTTAPGSDRPTSGLGLPAVKQAIDRMPGASVDLATKPNQFTQFEVRFPRSHEKFA